MNWGTEDKHHNGRLCLAHVNALSSEQYIQLADIAISILVEVSGSRTPSVQTQHDRPLQA